MSSIIGSGGTFTPTLVTVYETTTEPLSTVDVLLDGSVAYQLRHAGPKRGSIEAFFAGSLSNALALRADLLLAQKLQFTDATLTSLNMYFVVDPDSKITLRQDPTRKNWIVRFGFVEVP